MTPNPDTAADAGLRDLVERAVATHLRPSLECAPHPDEIAIVDSVMQVVGPRTALGALAGEPAQTEQPRCALRATHPWLSRLYACQDPAAHTVVMPITTAGGQFRGEALEARVCQTHAQHLARVYGAASPGATPDADISRKLDQLHLSVRSMASTMSVAAKAISDLTDRLTPQHTGDPAAPGMDIERLNMSHERMEVTVLLVEGSGEDAQAVVKSEQDEEPLRVPAELIEAGTGYDLDDMPGKRIVALVDDRGDLAGFERR